MKKEFIVTELEIFNWTGWNDMQPHDIREIIRSRGIDVTKPYTVWYDTAFSGFRVEGEALNG